MIGTKVLEKKESEFNGHLRVVKSFGLGTYIQANGLTQSGGVVEKIWKSTLRKIHNSKFVIHNSLILGLGGGTAAKLIRKKWPEAKIIGVDIDPVMIELGTKYLGLDRDELEIEIGDASGFVRGLSESKKRFDLIIVDLYNGDKFPEKFATENYIHLVRRLLAGSGIAVFNRLYYNEKRSDAVKFGLKLQRIFKKVEYYYPEANLMFLCYNS